MPILPQLEFCEGVLGLLPLVGHFRSGFLEERVRYEGMMAKYMTQIPAQLHCRILLKLGIIAMLQGEPGYACMNLKQAFELSKGCLPDVHIQAIAYLIQCRYMQFKWSAAGSNISSVELDDIFDFITEIQNLQASVPSINAYDYWYELQQKLKSVLELQRAIVSARPSVPTSIQLDLSRNQGTQRVTQAIQQCRLAGVEEANILPFIVELAHIYRLVGEHSRFHSLLDSVPQTPTNFILRAHCQLRLGDAMATTFGTPETWNMLLEQGTESNAQPRNDESTHFAIPPLQDLQEASSYYRTADLLYRSAQNTRGQAAVQLRLSYLATLGVFSASSTTTIAYKAALAHANQAELLYSQAGDIAGVQVATAHSCLCRIGLAQFPEDSDAAKTIGQYGKEKGSYSLAFGIGLFFAKYARRWLVFLGDYEKALAAHKLAAAVFEGLELKLSYAYSICDQLSVYELLGDQSMIYITATKASNVCHEIEQEKPRSSPIFKMALNHAVHVLGKIFQHANKRANPEQLARVADRFREWRRRGPTESVDQLMNRLIALQQRFQAAMNDGGTDMGECLARLNSLNMDPVDLQTQGAYNLIEYFISTADTLVPLYNSRKAVRNGDMDEAERLWRDTDFAIRAHPTSDSEILLASLSVIKRDFEAAAAHARAYESKFVTAEETENVGIDHETRDLLQRKKWQELTRVLSLFVRVRLYLNAQSILQKLELEFGPDWWSLYEYPIWENLSAIAQVSEGLGEYERACDFYERAMEAFDERRHALSVDDHKIALAGDSVVQDIYFGAAHAAARWHLSVTESTVGFLSPQIQRAFTAIERGKARSLLDLIEGSIPKPTSDGGVSSQWQQYKVQGTKLATLRSLLSRCYEAQHLDRSTESRLKTEIQEKEKLLRELEGKLSAGGPDPTSTIGTVLSLPSLCRLLPVDTALLQYCYSRENMVVWKITASGITELFVIDVPEACLEGHILKYHKACATASMGRRDHESWLATKLLPFKSLVESRLIIVPYRCLHQLPFHALPYQGQLLMSNKTISYLPSASVLGYIQCDPAPNSEISILAVGNPSKMASKDPLTSRESSLSPLPSAEVEVEAIKELVPKTMALNGAQATKVAVSAHLGKYRVLHFATHGSLSTEVPMLSAVHLADGQNITVEDFMWRDLRAELVVLSACNTGRGDLTSGDDLIGFARVFLAAGVKSVLVSLWSVDDDVTSFLMTKFYEHLKKEWSPAGALQAAQLATQQATRHEVKDFLRGIRRGTRSIEPEVEVRDTAQPEDYSNPMYWAPFIVIGSCRKLP